MPKFTSTVRRIQVGNGQYVGVLFLIPVVITIQKHRFVIFMLVSEIHENVDLVLGFKNRSIGPELTTAKTGPIHLS